MYKKLQQLSDDLYNSVKSGAHLTLHHIKYHWETWVSDPKQLNKNKEGILRKILNYDSSVLNCFTIVNIENLLRVVSIIIILITCSLEIFPGY